MVGFLVYSVVRALIDVLATRNADAVKLQAEVLALRRQVQVLERQNKRVHWSPVDRMVLADEAGTLPPHGAAAGT